jgi:hypothetical protein
MIVRTAATTVMVLAVLAGLVAACASGSTDPESACDAAVAQAVAIDPASDTVQPVDGGIAGCSSLEAWVAAAQKYPDAFGGQAPTSFARERCGSSTALAATPVCVELLGN